MIIGITGTLGAGKGTIVEFLLGKGFKHYSVRDYLTREINKQDLPLNRDSMTKVANELRAANSPSFIVEELYKEAEKAGGDAIIESIRTIGEVKNLQTKNEFYLFAVDCNIQKRYKRITSRGSATDSVSFEEFQNSEKQEMSSTDPNKQNLGKCIEMANYVFANNESIEDLNKKIKRVLDEISKS